MGFGVSAKGLSVREAMRWARSRGLRNEGIRCPPVVAEEACRRIH
jgi:hypothetical protein